MTPSLQAVVLDWQSGVLATVGLSIETVLAATYVGLAARARINGRAWPITRVVAFVAGVLVLVFSLQSGFAAYDEILWVHVVQHVLLMAVAPALLTLGAPLLLLLRSMRPANGRRVVGVVRHRWLNWMDGPSAALHLPLHYYGIMYVYLLTPAYALGQRSEFFHEFAHLYFIGCGLMFWLPVLGRHPSRWHPATETKVRMVAAGVPASLVLAGLVATFPPVNAATNTQDTVMGAGALAVCGVASSLFGLALVSRTAPRRRRATQAGAIRGSVSIAAARRA